MPFKDYRITSPFGWRMHPISGNRSFHTGIDLVKSHRAPIEAFTAGVVLFTGMGRSGTGLGGYGNVVLIQDRNNRGQLYAHLDSVSVSRGQQVSRGQVIGRQGNTGNSTGSHLHYEVRKKAENGPPYGWTADREGNCLEPTSYLRGFNHASAAVRNIQSTLNSRYGFNIAVDGIPGPETKGALIKAYQTELNRQFGRGLAVDGRWGPKTRAATVNVRRGAKGNLTWILQAILECRGHSPQGVDGIFGANTENAVRSFQGANKLSVDGVAGKNTWAKLFE